MSISSRFGHYPDSLARYVRATKIVDADHAFVRKQANELVRDARGAADAIRRIHSFVASLPHAYLADDMKASDVLRRGRGSCNTKASLMLALLRSLRIPCRVRVYRVRRRAHRKRIPVALYLLAPSTTVLLYPEIYAKGGWHGLADLVSSGDKPNWDACPFDDASCRTSPLKEEWVAADLGDFASPDDAYASEGTSLKGVRRLLFPLVRPMLRHPASATRPSDGAR